MENFKKPKVDIQLFYEYVENTEKVDDRGIEADFWALYHERNDNPQSMEDELKLIEEHRPKLAKHLRSQIEK